MASMIEAHPQRQAIIDFIAAGRSLREIARSVSPPVGIMALQRYAAKVVRPTMQARAEVDKLWVQNQLVDIVLTAKGGDDLSTARAALVNIAELNGFNAPRRTESLNLNLHAMPPAQLAAALRQTLSVLPASARAELAAAEPDLVEIVGEVLPPAEVGNQTRESE